MTCNPVPGLLTPSLMVNSKISKQTQTCANTFHNIYSRVSIYFIVQRSYYRKCYRVCFADIFPIFTNFKSCICFQLHENEMLINIFKNVHVSLSFIYGLDGRCSVPANGPKIFPLSSSSRRSSSVLSSLFG